MQIQPHAIIWLTCIALLLFATSCATGSTPTVHNTPTAMPPINLTPQPTPTPIPITPTPRPLLPLQLSSDPYSNVGQYQTEVEPGAFSYGSTIVTALQAGRFSNVGSANIAWATSADSGTTWKNGFLPG
nr:hypothetical protein [Ktedonobacteraceae bacterium]